MTIRAFEAEPVVGVFTDKHVRRDGRMTAVTATRRRPVTGVVVHTAETARYSSRSAHAVTNYGKTTTRNVSWHATVNHEHIIWNLDETRMGKHASGYNQGTLGIELATFAKWLNPDGFAADGDEWADQNHGLLTNAAAVVAYWCHRFGIKPFDANDRVLEEGKRGNVYRDGIFGHFATQPIRTMHGWSYRSDPGTFFPWAFFIDAVQRLLRQRIKNEDYARPIAGQSFTLPTWSGEPTEPRPPSPPSVQTPNIQPAPAEAASPLQFTQAEVRYLKQFIHQRQQEQSS